MGQGRRAKPFRHSSFVIGRPPARCDAKNVHATCIGSPAPRRYSQNFCDLFLDTPYLLNMRPTPILKFAFLLVLSAVAVFAADSPQILFNGKDLAGWRPPHGTWQ